MDAAINLAGFLLQFAVVLVLLTLGVNCLVYFLEFVNAWRQGKLMRYSDAERRVLSGSGSIVILPGFRTIYWWIDMWPRFPETTDSASWPKYDSEKGRTPFECHWHSEDLVRSEGHYLVGIPSVRNFPLSDDPRKPTGFYSIDWFESDCGHDE